MNNKVMWIQFHDVGLSASGKTRLWHVSSKPDPLNGISHHLGIISWFGRWRKYAFFPVDGSAFEWDCLTDIAHFVEARTKEHKYEKDKQAASAKEGTGILLHR